MSTFRQFPSGERRRDARAYDDDGRVLGQIRSRPLVGDVRSRYLPEGLCWVDGGEEIVVG